MKKKKAKPGKPANEESRPSIFAGKKKKIAGIIIILFSIFILLSIISYSRFDKANLSYSFSDLFKAFGSNSDFNHKADSTRNWLGIFGAYISDFFINSTLGISSIIFPVLVLAWGFSLFSKIEYRKLINASNFVLIAGLIVSTLFGIFRTHFQIFPDIYELSGSVGDYLGISLSHLLGGVGSTIFLFTIAIILLVVAFDIKIENVFHYLQSIFVSNTEDDIEETAVASNVEEDDSNLKKIKELGKKKKKLFAKEKAPTSEELKEEEAKEQTRIRIIRKDEPPVKLPVNESSKEDKKKEEPKKAVDSTAKEIDKDKEAELPNNWEEKISYKKPGLDLLEPIPKENFKVAEEELKRNAELLKEKLKLFDIDIKDISVTPGPVVTLYEIVPAPGVKISRIVGLEHDIALALAARGIRIIAPIPGKSAIGVEIPNTKASLVNARAVLSKMPDTNYELPIALGMQINGEVYVTDLAKMPHMLIAGSTGSGKSVGINMLIASLLYTKQPSEVKLIMIDPKKIELSFYNKLRRHYLAVSPDLEEEIITNPQNAVILLKAVEYEMEKRYDKLAKAGVRNIVDYNIKVLDPKKRPKDTDEIKHHPIPYLIVIIDELADLMITAGKEVEEPIARLAQLARAVGIHLVLATQRPSVNVITGVIKANFSARIAYQVATKIDSRTILDMNGAEQLLGRGDMLFLPTGSPKPIRIQNAFISTDEVERLTNYISVQPGFSKPYFLPSLYDKKKEAAGGFLKDLDPMFEDAARVIVRHQQGSVSLLQRRLKLGYSRAARIVDQLEEAGIVGPNDGSKARTVLVENDEQLETILRSL